jgi:ADP-L-glycero-D-manno-heptose 6-epimerase
MIYNNINFNQKTILITGGAGFIGSNLAFYFQDNFPNSKIVIFDCFRGDNGLTNTSLISLGHYKNLIGFRGNIISGNINYQSDLDRLSDYKFDFIFHHAAISDTRLYDQKLIMQTNVNSFYDILKIAQENSSTIVYASSAATYGSTKSPQTVGSELPENPYGYSKFVMDQIAMEYSNENPNMIISGLRFFNVYGPREFFKNNTASMVIQLAHQVLDGRIPRLFNGSKDIMRDFVYIEDVIQANIKACQPKLSGIYNIGTGKARSFQDIADILQKELDTDLGTEYFPNPFNGYQMHTEANIESSIENLGFKPEFSLEDGINAYIPYINEMYKTNNL